MAQGGMKPFYIGLGGILVVGAALIAWQVLGAAPKRPSLAETPLAPVGGSRGVVIGADSAPVEITEFSDFECPWCARFAVLTLPDIKSRLVATGRARFRFVHFPLDGHVNSPVAHLAAACANEQGRFWEMVDAIYNDQADWAASRRPDRPLREMAGRLGLDLGRYDSCVKEQRPWPDVMADKALGTRAGVDGTPSFMINGRMLLNAPATADGWVALVDSLAGALRQPGRTAGRPRG